MAIEDFKREAKKRRLRRWGESWENIPRDQRIGDIIETIHGLEPRKSDPFPRESVMLILDMARQGLPPRVIDKTLVDLLKRGRMWPKWRMKLSD